LPKSEYASIDTLKKRAMALGISAKKSELLRAGLMWLSGASDSALKAALTAVPTLKTGRPAAEKTSKPVAKAPVKTAVKTSAPRKAPAAKKAPIAAKKTAKAPVSRTRRTAVTKAKPAA
jgi:hypothetical protein